MNEGLGGRGERLEAPHAVHHLVVLPQRARISPFGHSALRTLAHAFFFGSAKGSSLTRCSDSSLYAPSQRSPTLSTTRRTKFEEMVVG